MTGEHTTGLSIGQVAERTGLSVHALRFYERQNLLPTPVLRQAGRRVYTEADLEWLTICVSLRSSGMPVDQIRRYTDLVRAGDGNEAERLALLREHEARVVDRLAELTRALEQTRYKIGVYERHLTAGTADTLWNPHHAGAAPDTDGGPVACTGAPVTDEVAAADR
ncbi:MerR family transcriptional regulator [Actinocatenispora comari]|uniref:MerR family transcriptional regulator n=1 Tax=Actinocatenispora comari TaxID=2807577 RepID=A0A8J4ADA0_9ACTN|nr:MerR family transcriptional regulator [Actinocatenispora comari]GIL29441.1 MerR family transcriptional regulator [Actinocatenispora comari]